MALVTAVRGGVRPSPEIVWTLKDGSVLNLSGATLSGEIRDEATGSTRVITGIMTVSDAAAGKFVWEYSAEDVAAAGKFEVTFTAAFESQPSPARNYPAKWQVVG